MLVAALVVTSAGIANLERDDDKALADIQAADLAQPSVTWIPARFRGSSPPLQT